MINLFLKAKHWQLFLLTFALPFVFQIIMMVNIFTHLINNPNPDPFVIFGEFKFFPVIMLLFAGALFGWIWSVAIGLQKFIPAGIAMKVKKFKVFFFVPIIYFAIIIISLGFIFNHNFSADLSGAVPAVAPLFAVIFLLIVPVHIFSMFCIFYCLYFAAKTFKTAELQRAVGFGDFVSEFFLMWFNVIGFWIIQPKINKMAEQLPEEQVVED